MPNIEGGFVSQQASGVSSAYINGRVEYCFYQGLGKSEIDSGTSASSYYNHFRFRASDGETNTNGSQKGAVKRTPYVEGQPYWLNYTEHRDYGAHNNVTTKNSTVKLWMRIA